MGSEVVLQLMKYGSLLVKPTGKNIALFTYYSNVCLSPHMDKNRTWSIFLCLDNNNFFSLFVGIFTGAVVLLALGVLTPFFKYIPKASLAALIITSVVTMIEYHILKNIWTVRRIDLVPLVITFVGCFYDIEIGIMCGIGSALVILLYPVVWPRISQSIRGDFVVLNIKGNLSYPGVEHLNNEIQAVALAESKPSTILVDFSMVTEIDFTVTQALQTALVDLCNRDIALYFVEVKDKVRCTMINSGIESGIINPNSDVVMEPLNSLQIIAGRE